MIPRSWIFREGCRLVFQRRVLYRQFSGRLRLLGIMLSTLPLFCIWARAETNTVDDWGSIPALSPADYMESKGERTNLAATGGDKVCGQTIYFDQKRLRLSEENLQFITKYEGEMKDNVPQGKGTLYFLQHETLVGFFENGLPHGQYVRYDDGDIALESGIYDKGRRTGTITFYYPNNFVSGIRGQMQYLDDKRCDGPLMYNEVSYKTGLIKRVFVGEAKGDETIGEWKDVVSIQVREHWPILLESDLFGVSELSDGQMKLRNDILYALAVAKITIFDASGNYVDPKANVSEAFLQKVIPDGGKDYIPKISELLGMYQKPLLERRVTTGTQGYTVLNEGQVTYAQFDPERNQFFGDAVTVLSNGDSFEGRLNSTGSTFEGQVVYEMASNGSKLVGQFSPAHGNVEGSSSYTFFDTSTGKFETKEVLVENGSWNYKTKAQEDYEATRHGITAAWKNLFHEGNVFKKLENGFRLARDTHLYPFVWAAVKYDLNTAAVTWNDKEGAGILIGKNGFPDINLTISDFQKVAVLVTGEGEETAALKTNFKTAIFLQPSDKFSYGIESNLKNVKDKGNLPFKKATITPVVAKKGAYFTTMTNVKPADAYDQFSNQRLMESLEWSPEQKDALAFSLFDDSDNQKKADQMATQLQGELIGTHLEHFYGVGPVQAAILTECINWTIGRMKNGLKPEYKFKLYALVALSKYAYDQSIWGNLTNPDKKADMTDRQKLIISESMKVLDEFDEFLKNNNQNRNQYDVQMKPFLY